MPRLMQQDRVVIAEIPAEVDDAVPVGLIRGHVKRVTDPVADGPRPALHRSDAVAGVETNVVDVERLAAGAVVRGDRSHVDVGARIVAADQDPLVGVDRCRSPLGDVVVQIGDVRALREGEDHDIAHRGIGHRDGEGPVRIRGALRENGVGGVVGDAHVDITAGPRRMRALESVEADR